MCDSAWDMVRKIEIVGWMGNKKRRNCSRNNNTNINYYYIYIYGQYCWVFCENKLTQHNNGILWSKFNLCFDLCYVWALICCGAVWIAQVSVSFTPKGLRRREFPRGQERGKSMLMELLGKCLVECVAALISQIMQSSNCFFFPPPLLALFLQDSIGGGDRYSGAI